MFVHSEIKKFIEEMIVRREGVSKKFQPAEWYDKYTITFRPNLLIDTVFIRFA